MRVFNTGPIFRATLLSAVLLPTATLADQVHLKSYDGSTDMTGEFLKYDAGTYELGTPIGTLRISAKLVACEGAPCPSFARVLTDLEAAGDVMMSQTSMGNDDAAAGPVFCPITGALLSEGPGS